MIVQAKDRATAEYRDAYQYYFERSPRAARAFAAAFDGVLERLERFPRIGPIARESTHRVVRVIHDRRSRAGITF